GDDARVAGLDVVGVETGLLPVGGGTLHVGARGQGPVVAHDVLRQLAGVLEVDREVLAGRVDFDRLEVELHRVVAFDVDRTGGEGGRRAEQQRGCERERADHGGSPRVATVDPVATTTASRAIPAL